MHTYLNSLLPGQPFFWRILFFATSVRTRTLDYLTKRRGKKRRQFYKHRVLFYTSSACSFKQVYSIYSKRSTSGSKSFTRNARGGRVKTLRIYLVEKKNTHVGKGKKKKRTTKKGENIYTFIREDSDRLTLEPRKPPGEIPSAAAAEAAACRWSIIGSKMPKSFPRWPSMDHTYRWRRLQLKLASAPLPPPT